MLSNFVEKGKNTTTHNHKLNFTGSKNSRTVNTKCETKALYSNAVVRGMNKSADLLTNPFLARSPYGTAILTINIVSTESGY